MRLDELHKVVRKWLFLKNLNRLDLILATYLSRTKKGTKIWIIFVGGSGAAKSELLRALENENTFILQEFTPNTLVSGNPMAEDLAPQLNNKVVLILDMAILLNLRKEDKAKVWAQLRELYDGNARKATGSGKKSVTGYTNLNITLLACSTPVLDDQILIHQSLGTRELLYRINPIEEKEERKKLMQKVMKNENHEEQMRKEIKNAIQEFIKDKEYKDIEIPEETLEQIKKYVEYICVMRTSASHDSYTGDLLSTAEPEAPTRVLKQFVRLYRALKSLDPDYSDEKALKVIKEVRDSSCNRDRVKVIKTIAKEPDSQFSISEIAQKIRLGKSSIQRHLSLLWNLKMINRIHLDTINGRDIYKWQLNQEEPTVQIILEEMGVKPIKITQEEVT